HQYTPMVTPQPRAKTTPIFATGTQRVIYLNRKGGTYKPGATDAATNASQLVEGGTAVIPPLNEIGTGFDWSIISKCVRDHFKPYDIRIVETEPPAGSGSYIEAVVGGNGTELGFGRDQLFGIASADDFCNVTEKGIAFSFSESHDGVPMKNLELCATIAHEVGHVVALEHEALPVDLMSYVLIAESGSKTFASQDSQCGTSPSETMAQCSCGGGTTNSSGRLGRFVGVRPVESTAPTLAVTSPGATAAPSFEVIATATDDMEMADVVVSVDGVEVGFDAVPEGNTYKLTVSGVREGDRMVKVVARDRAGNEAVKDIAVKVAKLQIGDSCVANDACTDNLCADIGDGGFCTKTCDLAADACPDGFECIDAGGGQAVCITSSEGGCCQSSPGSSTTALLALLGVGLVLRRRRR
nr:hypothetical protein [Deltaproteobacteria bacterium]